MASQSSSYQKPQGNPEYAIYPPESNTFTLRTCSHTVVMQTNSRAWWMFQFSFGFAHITNITIYYRENCTYIYMNIITFFKTYSNLSCMQNAIPGCNIFIVRIIPIEYTCLLNANSCNTSVYIKQRVFKCQGKVMPIYPNI